MSPERDFLEDIVVAARLVQTYAWMIIHRDLPGFIGAIERYRSLH